ncbi:probable vacuolar amino acid transporter YPQ1 isoform X2 [Andrographis paniculata]|uniref:probable vacuolar amino acid transporter YPQ1 isoform X2 n=1 Tax=Andrographis paniculata TaxID=175694 RepID=UPI0021E897B6|nr:probable vacuolar amino acid transporter YPQ1 isoform X2 [Andrographis paniculata]
MKSAVHNSLHQCLKENHPCILGWVEKYFNDCLCNIRDEFSFGFGMASVVCWGVAELPQIITNFRTKSSHGVSLLFLVTWITGDVLNLVGCLLEPATLPTQFYTAVLYTTTTVVLFLQSLYYDYFFKWRRSRQSRESDQEVEDVKKPLRPQKQANEGIPIPTTAREPYYYTSARSMAGSMTPPIWSQLRPIKSGPSALVIDNDSSSSEDDEANAVSDSRTVTKPQTLPTSARYGAFFATAAIMPRESSAILIQAYAGFTGRKLLLMQDESGSVFGQWLGWIMAAIYMTGRLPQIWLNIKRGSVEGLNPFMFIFAILGNATYVASILVRSIAWDKIKANMPWLLDAVACVLLDLFIMVQYVYYRYFRRQRGMT